MSLCQSGCVIQIWNSKQFQNIKTIVLNTEQATKNEMYCTVKFISYTFWIFSIKCIFSSVIQVSHGATNLICTTTYQIKEGNLVYSANFDKLSVNIYLNVLVIVVPRRTVGTWYFPWLADVSNNENEACFKRQTLHAPNALKTKENEVNYLIIM